MIKWLPPVGGVFVAVTLGLTACVQGPEGQACNAGQCPSGRSATLVCAFCEPRPARQCGQWSLALSTKIEMVTRHPEDCNDDDPPVHPGAEDAVGDNRDTNCDDVDGVRGSSGFDGDLQRLMAGRFFVGRGNSLR